MFHTSRDKSELQRARQGIQQAFGKVREELDDHLDTINRNSTEIQGLYEYFMLLEKKLDKLNERVDDMFIRGEQSAFSGFTIDELNLREQEVFMCLYASQEPVHLIDMSRRLGFTLSTLNKYLMSLMKKGVPLLRQVVNNDVFVSLELKFKDLQAKNKLVNIDERVSQQLTSEKII